MVHAHHPVGSRHAPRTILSATTLMQTTRQAFKMSARSKATSNMRRCDGLTECCTVARASRLTERNEFAHGQRRHTILFVKINRGELEERRFCTGQGDVGPLAVFLSCCQAEQHPVFERLGDDLWYYDRTPVEATKLSTYGRTLHDKELHEA